MNCPSSAQTGFATRNQFRKKKTQKKLALSELGGDDHLLWCQHPKGAPALFVISEWQGVHKQEAFDVAAPRCSFDANVSAKDACLLILMLTSGKKAVYINISITPWSFDCCVCLCVFPPKNSNCLHFEQNTLQFTPVLTCRLHPFVQHCGHIFAKLLNSWQARQFKKKLSASWCQGIKLIKASERIQTFTLLKYCPLDSIYIR